MNILPHWHAHRSHEPSGATALADARYDAQTDLALPTRDHDVLTIVGAGELLPASTGPGYDLARDIGL